MKTLFAVIALLLLPVSVLSAQTDVSPYVYATATSGQMTRFGYVATAGTVELANQLEFLLFSLWAMFLFLVFLWRRAQK
jgi:hypothetical protein